MACEDLQRDRDERTAAELVKDGAALASSCLATPEVDQKGALFFACNSFRTSLESALGEAIAQDDGAWAILCPEGDSGAGIGDRNFQVTMGCSEARTKRGEMAEEALLADPVALDAKCASTPKEELHMPLYGACLERKSRLRTAAIELRASDPQEFDRACARFRKTNDAGNQVYGLTDEQEMCQSAWRLRENRKAYSEAKAKGLACFRDVIYSPERPRCVTQAEYDKEMDVGRDSDPARDDRFHEDSSLSQAARAEAAAIIAKAKADGTYPKRKPGDRF